MTQLIECCSCYCLFDPREGYPDLKVCPDCEPDPENMPDWLCPKCGWNCENMLGEPDAPVTYSEERPHWEWSYCGGCNWTEYWTCPLCGTKFEVETSNV